jgi:SH3 domain-containing YSC84-like protein 1
MKQLVCAVATVVLVARVASADVSPSEAARLTNAARIVQEIKADIDDDYWNRARCVAVIPELKKAAFIVGGEFGKGVMSCRAGERWSAPVFIQLAKGSWGFQAGAEQVDLVLLVMNENGVQKLLNNKVNLGADASVAAGPVGRHGSIGTDAQLTAEILSYSRAKGLFAGINLSGGVLRPDEDANASVYGSGAAPRTILASRDISAPTQASAFIAALGTAAAPTAATATSGTPATAATEPVKAPSQEARSTEPAPRAATTPTTDDDVRAQATAIRQAIDQLLANASPTPVGTTGTNVNADAAPGTIAVERARLLQLRQQIDALIASLNRR